MTKYFLGVDIGGTKSHAMIADDRGNVLGLARGGSGNHESVGYDGTRHTLAEITSAAFAQAGISAGQVCGAGFGVGGYDWLSERADHMAAISVIGLDCPIALENDAIIGLVAGAEAGWGVALVAGTGNNARSWNRHHAEGKVTGAGTFFGENGGSGEMVYRAMQQVVKQWTMRGPKTTLTEAFIQKTGALDLDDLVEGLTQGRYSLRADAAPLVFAAAEAGDAVAAEVIRWTAEELGSLAEGVIRQVEIQDEAFDIVLVGSLFKGGPRFVEPLRARILPAAPRARLVRLEAPPVVGAVLIGMDAANFPWATVRPNLMEQAMNFEELKTA